ncbi:MAG TPA: HipA family kinase [Verrucomicrobiae bacterium]|nr:HipA family kinase [Verrucomicrobiae bacterium]
METLQLTANQFIRAMSTGRNHPLLLGCEDVAGNYFEVVVKFRGREMTETAQIAELVSAQLADDLGLQVPQAAVVTVPAGFETVIAAPDAAKVVKASPGINFGSVNIGAGFTTWPPGRTPHGAQRDQAADIFTFDTLVQNPDRRVTNPNLWARSDRIGVYDHEQAFQFLTVHIFGGGPQKPWATKHQGNGFDFLKQHIFYTNLRGGRLNLGPFKEKLSALTDRKIQGYFDAVPAEWQGRGDFCERIAGYLGEARQHREGLVNFVQHILR